MNFSKQHLEDSPGAESLQVLWLQEEPHVFFARYGLESVSTNFTASPVNCSFLSDL